LEEELQNNASGHDKESKGMVELVDAIDPHQFHKRIPQEKNFVGVAIECVSMVPMRSRLCS
jgi:hypothetical protein